MDTNVVITTPHSESTVRKRNNFPCSMIITQIVRRRCRTIGVPNGPMRVCVYPSGSTMHVRLLHMDSGAKGGFSRTKMRSDLGPQ